MRGLQMKSGIIAFLLFSSAATAGEVWVTNEKGNSVSVISTETLEVVNTYPTGERPRGLVFSEDFSRLYISTSDRNVVQVMDPHTGEVLHELPSGEDPGQFVRHPNDRHLYIANEDDATTTVVDVITRDVIARISVGIEPEGMAVSPNGKIAVTTSESTNIVHWIDTTSHEIFANSLVDNRPRHAEFRGDGTELWVSSEIGGTITIFDTETRMEKAKIEFEIPGVESELLMPVGFEFSKGETHAFVALSRANHLAVVNTDTYLVEDYILVGRRVWHLAFNGDRSLLFTTNGVSSDVTVVDVATRKPLKSIKVGRYPWGAAWRALPTD